MAFEETLVICLSVCSCVGLASVAYYLSELKKETLRQYGITQRQQMKVGAVSDNPYGAKSEWWLPIVVELMKNPTIQNMVMEKITPMIGNIVQQKVE